ncbi:NADP-dependent oxidoreductase domain-containing protein [Melanogaster broomeanus]|nr:NADP-dependent oxidoreductase domain-containing protein [Melanogaster broomeanus]
MPPSTIALNDGTQAPWIAFGTGTALYDQDASKPVTLAIKNGFTHLDSAQMYKNETSMHQAGALQESLKKLGMDYVDQYLVHLPAAHEDLQEVWRGMEEAQRSVSTQIEAHPYVWVDLKENLALHKEYSIVTSSFGGLTPTGFIEKIRARLQSQVLIKWLKQNDVLVVTTSSKGERLRDYLDAENVPDLTE